jgi:hypothetical protein
VPHRSGLDGVEEEIERAIRKLLREHPELRQQSSQR